jgi:hypothetical protein
MNRKIIEIKSPNITQNNSSIFFSGSTLSITYRVSKGSGNWSNTIIMVHPEEYKINLQWGFKKG